MRAKFSFVGSIPPDSDGNGRIPNASISYEVIDEWGELDVCVQSIDGMSAVIPKGAGRGARSQVSEGLRERAKAIALFHYFTNHAAEEFE